MATGSYCMEVIFNTYRLNELMTNCMQTLQWKNKCDLQLNVAFHSKSEAFTNTRKTHYLSHTVKTSLNNYEVSLCKDSCDHHHWSTTATFSRWIKQIQPHLQGSELISGQEQLTTARLSRDDRSEWHPVIFTGGIIYNLASCITQREAFFSPVREGDIFVTPSSCCFSCCFCTVVFISD